MGITQGLEKLRQFSPEQNDLIYKWAEKEWESFTNRADAEYFIDSLYRAKMSVWAKSYEDRLDEEFGEPCSAAQDLLSQQTGNLHI